MSKGKGEPGLPTCMLVINKCDASTDHLSNDMLWVKS